jgi:hypothetical protein
MSWEGIYAEDLDGYPLVPNTDNYLSKECKHMGLAALSEARHDLINLGIGSEPTEGLHVFDLDAYDEELKKDARGSFALAGQYKMEATHQYKDNCECEECKVDRAEDAGATAEELVSYKLLVRRDINLNRKVA